jgi:hypothetical protein
VRQGGVGTWGEGRRWEEEQKEEVGTGKGRKEGRKEEKGSRVRLEQKPKPKVSGQQ